MTVERCEVASKIAQIEEPINTTQEVIGGNVVVEIERIKQCTLIAATLTHHLGALPSRVLRSKTLKTQRRSIVFQQNRPSAAGRKSPLSGSLLGELARSVALQVNCRASRRVDKCVVAAAITARQVAAPLARWCFPKGLGHKWKGWRRARHGARPPQ